MSLPAPEWQKRAAACIRCLAHVPVDWRCCADDLCRPQAPPKAKQAAPPPAAAAPPSEEPKDKDPEKEARKLRKKIRECDSLVEKKAKGEVLTDPEADKLNKLASW